MSLRAPQARGNLKGQNSLEANERSPRLHSQPRDDMHCLKVVQQLDKLEFEEVIRWNWIML